MNDLTLAMALADAADQASIRRFAAQDLQVETKPDATPATEVDFAVERLIRRRLEQARPRDAVLGEEEGGEPADGRLWVVDPIDATKNYLRGCPVFGTLIALQEDQVTTVAVVSAPLLRRRWHATLGGGAWEGGERLTVSGVRQCRDAYFSHGSLRWWEAAGLLSGFDRLWRRCWRQRAFGDFWAYMLVAEGAIDVAIEPSGLSLWDTVAPRLIVEEAGGTVTTTRGGTVFDGSMVATNGHVHGEVLQLLAD